MPVEGAPGTAEPAAGAAHGTGLASDAAAIWALTVARLARGRRATCVLAGRISPATCGALFASS
jgi:hypothetical protein